MRFKEFILREYNSDRFYIVTLNNNNYKVFKQNAENLENEFRLAKIKNEHVWKMIVKDQQLVFDPPLEGNVLDQKEAILHAYYSRFGFDKVNKKTQYHLDNNDTPDDFLTSPQNDQVTIDLKGKNHFHQSPP